MSVPTPTTIDGLPTLTINALDTANSIDAVNDYLPIYQNSSTSTVGISRNTLLGISSAPLGLTDSQSPTNKTFDNTNALTIKDGSFTLQNTSDSTKQAVFSLSGITTGNTRTISLPDYSATMASLAGTETLTNKTLTSPTISSPTITNATLSTDAITGYTSPSTGTVYGMSVASGLLTSAAILGKVNTAAIQSSAVTTAKIATNNVLSTLLGLSNALDSTNGVQTQTNTGTSGGTINYINLGGIKIAWGKTAAVSTSTTPQQYTITWPTSFFSTIQTYLVAVYTVSITQQQYATGQSTNITTGQITFTSNNTATATGSFLAIGT